MRSSSDDFGQESTILPPEGKTALSKEYRQQDAVLELTEGRPLAVLEDEEIAGLLKAQADRLDGNLDTLRGLTHAAVEVNWTNVLLGLIAATVGALAWTLYLLAVGAPDRLIIVAEISTAIFAIIAFVVYRQRQSSTARRRLYGYYRDQILPIVQASRVLIHESEQTNERSRESVHSTSLGEGR